MSIIKLKLRYSSRKWRMSTFKMHYIIFLSENKNTPYSIAKCCMQKIGFFCAYSVNAFFPPFCQKFIFIYNINTLTQININIKINIVTVVTYCIKWAKTSWKYSKPFLMIILDYNKQFMVLFGTASLLPLFVAVQWIPSRIHFASWSVCSVGTWSESNPLGGKIWSLVKRLKNLTIGKDCIEILDPRSGVKTKN